MSSEYRYQHLEKLLLKGIEQQRWRVGERLPSIRSLCVEHNLSKATVQHALQRLEAKGVVAARPKAGYFVTPQPGHIKPPSSRARIEPPQAVTVSSLLLDIMGRSAAFDLVPDFKQQTPPPGILALNRSVGRALRREKANSFQYYDEPAGDYDLREQISLHYSRRGWVVSPDQLCITSGCQHGLFLALMAVCERGDVVAVESPGFYGALQLLEQLELRVVEVPTSIQTGMDMDALEEVLDRWKVKACIVSPTYSTPGGALMPMESKQRLLTLAERHNLAVIEDDIYADTAFDTVPDPLKTLDTEDRVILCSSFSKSLSRDLRLGWICGGRWHQQIVRLKLVTQLASSRTIQQGVAEFMKEGGYGAHLRRQRFALQENRDQLLTLLQAWPQGIKVSRPEGGLAVWVELPNAVNTLSAYVPALNAGVVITPGPLFSVSEQFTHCLRIGYAHAWNAERTHALHQLRELLFLGL